MMTSRAPTKMMSKGVAAFVDRGGVPVLSPFQPDPATRSASGEPRANRRRLAIGNLPLGRKSWCEAREQSRAELPFVLS